MFETATKKVLSSQPHPFLVQMCTEVLGGDVSDYVSRKDGALVDLLQAKVFLLLLFNPCNEPPCREKILALSTEIPGD